MDGPQRPNFANADKLQIFKEQFVNNSNQVSNGTLKSSTGYTKNLSIIICLIRDKSLTNNEIVEAFKDVKIDLYSQRGFAVSPELRTELRLHRGDGKTKMKLTDLLKTGETATGKSPAITETPSAQIIASMEDAEVALLKLFDRATVDTKTASSYGGLEPGVDDYTMCNSVQILGIEKLTRPAYGELGGIAKEKFTSHSDDGKFVAMTFDNLCFAQGGTLGGVADFKMGMLHQALEEKFGKDGFVWHWYNDEPCYILIPLAPGQELEMVNKIAGLAIEPYAEKLMSKLENGPLELSYWGLNSNEDATVLEMTKTENASIISLSSPYKGDRMQKVLQEQWPKATVELNRDKTELSVHMPNVL